jgi:hypothetical protein
MSRAAGVVAALLAACGGASATQPEPLHAPERRPHDDTAPPRDDPAYIEDCTTDFHRPATHVAAEPRLAEQLTAQGDALLAQADHEPDGDARAARTVEAVGKYRDALVKDPYDATATLELALAYDRVYRKGCALQMLRRLDALAHSKQLGDAARAAIGRVGDNTQWFKAYRREAQAALGL